MCCWSKNKMGISARLMKTKLDSRQALHLLLVLWSEGWGDEWGSPRPSQHLLWRMKAEAPAAAAGCGRRCGGRQWSQALDLPRTRKSPLEVITGSMTWWFLCFLNNFLKFIFGDSWHIILREFQVYSIVTQHVSLCNNLSNSLTEWSPQ